MSGEPSGAARGAPASRRGRAWSLAAFGASFAAVGAPYWATPYAAVSLPHTLVTPALLVVVAAAAGLRWLGAASLWNAVWIAGAAVPAAVVARVAVDVAADPTSHNLWPFEVAFVLPVGFVSALAGAVAGGAAAWVAGRRPGSARS